MQDENATAAPAREGRRAALAVAAVTLVMAFLVTWAASIGPSDVLRSGGFANFGTPTPTTTSASPTGSPGPEQLPRPPGDTPAVVQVLMVALFVLFAVAIIALLVLAVRFVWNERLRWRRRARADHLAFDVLTSADADDALAAAVAADAGAQLAALGEGTPRNGIVACWARFEDQAAAAGVRPEEWETSSEFALRILEMVQADTSAVAGLAELFREARYSEHEVTEAQRAAAIAMLGRIHASLGRRPQRSDA